MNAPLKLGMITGILSMLTIASTAQTTKQIQNKVADAFASYTPSEKIYLHTDKKSYFIGDTIWLKAYLQNASDLAITPTNFIYVDLIDARDSIIMSKTIKRTGGIFAGYIAPGKLANENDYTLRAYTTWMRNFPSEYYYYQPVRFSRASSTDLQMKAAVEITDSTSCNIRLNLYGEHIVNPAALSVSCTLQNLTSGKRSKSRNEQTNEAGDLLINAQGVQPGDILMLDVKCILGKTEYSNLLRVAVPKADYEVRFLPEGGELIAGSFRRVAFKAIANNGNPIHVSGYILNAQQDTIAHITAQHDGMGTIELPATSGAKYTAYTYSADSILKITPLPAIKTNGVALSMATYPDKVVYTVEKVGAYQGQMLYALVHTRGTLQYVMPLENNATKHSIPIQQLTPGISHVVIIDHNNTPLAERLFFVQPQKTEITLQTKQKTYATRDSVHLTLTLPDSLRGNFSIAITDNKFVKPDSLQNNIVSSLLLTSDLRGTINNPAQYMNNPQVDLLMLTNGWTRFKTPDILNQQSQNSTFPRDSTQYLNGTVYGLGKKLIKNSGIAVTTPKTLETQMTLPKMDGTFCVNRLTIEGKQTLVVRVLNGNNKTFDATLETLPQLRMPPVKLPLLTYSILPPTTPKKSLEGIITTELSGEKLDFSKPWIINNVVITAKKKRTDQDAKPVEPYRLSYQMSHYHSAFNEFLPHIKSDLSLRQILRQKGWDKYPCIVDRLGVIDDASMDLWMGKNIAAIELYTDTRWKKWVVVETFILNPHSTRNIEKNAFQINFNGYDKFDKEFYSPQYANSEPADYDVADSRTTVYWNPNLKLSNQPTDIKFFTTDINNTIYTVTLEGITYDCRPLWKTCQIHVTP